MNQYLAQLLSYDLGTFINRFHSLIYTQNRPKVFFSNPGSPDSEPPFKLILWFYFIFNLPIFYEMIPWYKTGISRIKRGSSDSSEKNSEIGPNLKNNHDDITNDSAYFFVEWPPRELSVLANSLRWCVTAVSSRVITLAFHTISTL